jgi:hypothetical protein
MRQTLYVLISLTVLSCDQVDKAKRSYRDTVLEKYVDLVGRSGKYDTTDQSYIELKAYIKNDTTLLKQLDSSISKQTRDRENWDLWKSDIPLPELKQLEADDAFRFIFSIYGLPAYEAMTVYKNDSSIKLHYLFYKHNRKTSKFEKVREFEKSITRTQSREFTSKIDYADYWGLKNDREYRGEDGNDLTVIGYQKSGDFVREHYVHRWGQTTLDEAFYFIYYKLLDKKNVDFRTTKGYLQQCVYATLAVEHILSYLSLIFLQLSAS